MAKKLLLLTVVFIVVALTGSAALALAPMGTPTAGLKQGQFRAGVDYSFSETDLELKWSDATDTIKDLQSNGIWANLGYGLADMWEAFVRLGAANGEFDKIETAEGDEDVGFDGDYGFSFGFGTKYTFWQQQENLNWGTLFQINWLNTEDKILTGDDEDGASESKVEVDAYEIQIAVGPNWKATDSLSIYGGPFLHFLNGDLDTEDETGDLEQESEFGGYVGSQVDLAENTSLYGELQFTGDAWAFGTGIAWKF